MTRNFKRQKLRCQSAAAAAPEMLELKSSLNSVVDQLNGFATEVQQAAQEVGSHAATENPGQTPGISGAWKDIAGNVNLMAATLAGKPHAAFQVFVLHEDTITGVRAAAVLGRLADFLEREPVMQNEIWKFDSLAHPALCEQALAQAIEADMIIVSAGGGGPLPLPVARFLSAALAHKQDRPSALVALLDLKAGRQPFPLRADLQELAEKFCVDFFCNTGESRWRAPGGDAHPASPEKASAGCC